MNDTFLDRDNLRQNNFGALRLLLALLVLVSHTFAGYYGNDDREPFYRLVGGQMDISAYAVNGFFAISGFLITLSWLRTPRFKTFMMKRILRIYPGFIVASLVSLLIVAPLAGANGSIALKPLEIAKSFVRIVMLSGPKAEGAFGDQPIPVLNLSLWTIRYEFICYLMVPVLVLLLSRLKISRIGITVVYLAMLVWHSMQGAYLVKTGALDLPIVGSLDVWPRFLCYFLSGMVLAFNSDRIPFRHWIAALCLAAMAVSACFPVARPGHPDAGGPLFIVTAFAGMYLIFYAAYQQTVKLSHIGEKVDLSYGVYLYAWPVTMLCIVHLRHRVGPWGIIAIELPITLALAAMSWFFVEKPFLVKKAKLVRKANAETVTPAPAVPAGPLAFSSTVHLRAIEPMGELVGSAAGDGGPKL